MFRVLADFYPVGATPQLTTATVLVPGAAPATKPLVRDYSPKAGTNMRVSLETIPENPVVGNQTQLGLKLDESGALERYLGAWGHMLVASADLSQPGLNSIARGVLQWLARFLIRTRREEEAMSDENLLTRREFTVETALAMLAGVTITITGCGDDDDNGNPTSATQAPASGKSGTVSTDAGHSHGGAEITSAQLTAQMAIMLTLTGAGHTHRVDLTGNEVGQISNGARVQKTSSNDNAHMHTVTFN